MDCLKQVIKLVIKAILRVQKLDFLTILLDLFLEFVDSLRELLRF